jgi:hypothetical protein
MTPEQRQSTLRELIEKRRELERQIEELRGNPYEPTSPVELLKTFLQCTPERLQEIRKVLEEAILIAKESP